MKPRLLLSAVFLATLVTPFAYSQENQDDDQVFELSPYEVNTDGDIGYLATSTLAGTRLNSSLRDVAASITVWTPEFIEDTGMTEIDELIQYSLNTVLDLDDQAGAGGNFNTLTNATAIVQRVRTRGIEASKGIDYFKAIIPDDTYKVSRYDDARGPNGVLFGISNAGGLINQTSLRANVNRNSGRVRYSFGSNSRDRAEFRHNQVLIDDKLAVVIAGLHQDNGHWRRYGGHEKERFYAAAKWQVTSKITLQANVETGEEHRVTMQPSTIADRGLPFYDNLLAFGVDAVTFKPTGGNPKNNMREVGVTGRDGNRNANRFTYIENDGTFFNASGTFLTGGYDDERVRHPDGSPGLGDRAHRINDQSLLPYYLNPGGPDFFRQTDFDSHSVFLDAIITKDWFVNFQYGYQNVELDVPQINGPRPEFRADPNTIQGLKGPANPYAGQFYFDGDYRRDKNASEYREFRLSSSYRLETDSKWLGRHQIGLSASRVDETQHRGNTWLALGGNPSGSGTFIGPHGNRYTNSNYLSQNNRVTIRNYIDLNDFSTWRAGSWRSLPETVTTDRFTGVPTEYPLVWAESVPGNINFLADTRTDSYMAVTQSFFWDDRLVVTLGYRNDTVFINRAGHYRDPLVGWVPDRSITEDTPSTNDIIPASPDVEYGGNVRTTGLVFHLNDHFSIVANEASSVGVPDFRRTVYPAGLSAPPTDGSGIDFGLQFNLLDRRISGRIVYYETESLQEATGGSQVANPNEDIYDTLEMYLEGAALENLINDQPRLRPNVNGRFRDSDSSGFEFRLTTNITSNWRLQFNLGYTDRNYSNTFGASVAHLGLIENGDGTVIQGATESQEVPDPEDPDNTIQGYTIDPSAYTQEGIISDFLAYGAQLPAPYTMDNTGISQAIFDIADNVNDIREREEKRWGLRPYRINVFTAYDFKEGFLNGWSIGGGYRWNTPNIIGEENDEEFEGEAQQYADLFLRYRTKPMKSFLGEGRWTFQLNIQNLFDNTKIIPSRLAVDGNVDYQVPGGRGPAYARFDLAEPRSYRFTVTYQY